MHTPHWWGTAADTRSVLVRRTTCAQRKYGGKVAGQGSTPKWGQHAGLTPPRTGRNTLVAMNSGCFRQSCGFRRNAGAAVVQLQGEDAYGTCPLPFLPAYCGLHSDIGRCCAVCLFKQ
eukprot:gene8419-biopygen9164